MFARGLLIVLVGLISFSNLVAQEIRINGGFVEDSMQVGQEVHYWLTATYPQELEILFPDSLSDFTPFEYMKRTYQPTAVRGGMLFDTTMYSLQSFEVDPVQSLKLSIQALKGSDTLNLTSPIDSIHFADLVMAASDTTSLIANTTYIKVPRQFNYPMFYIIIGILAVIVIVVILLFGKKILAAWKIRQLKKDYLKFNEQLTNYIRSLKEEPKITTSEHALIDWKTFMERLEDQPYTKMTSKEILNNTDNKELQDTLKSIDRVVYGHVESPTIYKSFQSIEDFTQHRFQLKINQLKDGAGYRK